MTEGTVDHPTRPVPPRGLAPFVSVLMPVRNEEAHIIRTLGQVLGQHYPCDRFEVIVADGGSTDATRELVAGLQRRHANLYLLDNPAGLSSAGRNVALGAARGDLVVVIDGHCELDDRWHLAELADAFERSGADCVGRPQPLDVTGASRVQRAIAAARSSALGHHPDSHIYSDAEGFVPPQSVAVAYRRSVFNAIGWFDERFDACEDVEFNHRVAQAGMRCFFTPRVAVRYQPRGSLGGLFRQMARYGRGRVRLLSKHPETFTVKGFLPAVLVVGLVLGPFFGLLTPWLGWAYAGCVGLYAAAIVLGSGISSISRRDAALLPLLPLVFLTIHFGAGWGQVSEMFSRRKSPTPAAQVSETARRRAA